MFSLTEFNKRFSTEKKCKEHLRKNCWRKGRPRAIMVSDVKAKTILPHVIRNVVVSTVINMEECPSYKALGKIY